MTRYEPDELPGCSTPHGYYSGGSRIGQTAALVEKCKFKNVLRGKVVMGIVNDLFVCDLKVIEFIGGLGAAALEDCAAVVSFLGLKSGEFWTMSAHLASQQERNSALARRWVSTMSWPRRVRELTA